MKTILLSIIIPVYNVEEYLEQCLDSVFSQDLTNCEVICVNDGSTDSSREILSNSKDNYSGLIIIDQKNKGLAAARNSGLKVAIGKYIYFLDSDDYLLENVIQKMLSFVLENDLDLALFNSINSNEKTYFSIQNRISGKMNGRKFYRLFHSEYNHFPPSVQWLYLYRREFLDNSGIYFPEDNLQEDEPYTVKAFFNANSVGMLNISILYHRLFREGSITKTAGIPSLIDALKAWNDLYNYLRKENCNDRIFYYKIFELYHKTILKTRQFAEIKKDLFSVNDFQIMKYCSVNVDLYKYYWYFSKGELFYNWNISKQPRYRIAKKIINRSLSIYYKLFVKHA